MPVESKFISEMAALPDDPIPNNFFGAAGVAEIAGLQDVLLHVGMQGYRHHVGVTTGKHIAPIQEALEKYLDFDVTIPQTEL